jgi:hypothetical protein
MQYGNDGKFVPVLKKHYLEAYSGEETKLHAFV